MWMCSGQHNAAAAAAAVDAIVWMLWFVVAWVQRGMRQPEPFHATLNPQGWQPTPGEEGIPLFPLCAGVLSRIS